VAGFRFITKRTLINTLSVIEQHNFGIIWIKISKCMFGFDEDVYICHMFIPDPPNSNVYATRDFDFFDKLELDILKYNQLAL
jgi:hypothetical protein